MEKRFANRVKTFLMAGKGLMREKHLVVPQEMRDELVEDIVSFLEQAQQIGVLHGQAMLPLERAISFGGAKDLLSRAKDIVAGIIGRIQDAIEDALNGDGEDLTEALSQTDIVETTMNDLIDDMPELVAESEIQGVVVGAVIGILRAQRVKKMRWLCEPDACVGCQHLADSDPVDVDAGEFEGGVTPPLHLRCRCQIGVVDE